MVLIEVIFCYNFAKYEANFSTSEVTALWHYYYYCYYSFSVIIRNDLSIKSVKAFPTTFQLYCHLTLLS